MAHRPSPLASYKRIILCADGTWLASDLGDRSVPSNVAKLARAMARSGPDADGKIVKQITAYHSGLGTGDLPFQKAIYGGFGWGLDNDICQMYSFISNNYEAGDELFFFGFSRGAFTARSVASLICDIGVLPPVHMDHFAAMWKAYRANTGGEDFKKTTWYLDNKPRLNLKDVTINVIGVWDTVGALGIPDWPQVKLLRHLGIDINKQYAFHNTNLSPNVNYAFQALALDEKRITFPPSLWHKTPDAPAKDLQQCWFPGVHANIGGQADDQLQEIGDDTLAWMIDNLSGMLTFEKSAVDLLIEQHRCALNSIHASTNGWGCGTITDNFAGMQGLFFWSLGRKDRTPGQYPRHSGDGHGGETNETFHPTVRMRRNKVSGWSPPSMQGYAPQEPDSERGVGWTWAKTGVRPVPEYIIRPEKTMSVAYVKPDGSVGFASEKSLTASLCPKDVLRELNKENGLSDAGANAIS